MSTKTHFYLSFGPGLLEFIFAAGFSILKLDILLQLIFVVTQLEQLFKFDAFQKALFCRRLGKLALNQTN